MEKTIKIFITIASVAISLALAIGGFELRQNARMALAERKIAKHEMQLEHIKITVQEMKFLRRNIAGMQCLKIIIYIVL
ncbi:MAG: hypothetical protein GY750_14060 [Lentisphaerae bacterium]|nr:hypothetical protein [Lentisphaerota bacterium]MCP4102524.1 hypothetical protein [Lentisphaerota bacterium]